jgi:hypothetical protein
MTDLNQGNEMSYAIAPRESTMKCERIRVIVDGCPISLTCYAIQGTFFCKADNIPPNLWTTHAIGTTREEAERMVLEQARQLIAKSRSGAQAQATIHINTKG